MFLDWINGLLNPDCNSVCWIALEINLMFDIFKFSIIVCIVLCGWIFNHKFLVDLDWIGNKKWIEKHPMGEVIIIKISFMKIIALNLKYFLISRKYL